MIKFDDITVENIKERNPNFWSSIQNIHNWRIKFRKNKCIT